MLPAPSHATALAPAFVLCLCALLVAYIAHDLFVCMIQHRAINARVSKKTRSVVPTSVFVAHSLRFSLVRAAFAVKLFVTGPLLVMFFRAVPWCARRCTQATVAQYLVESSWIIFLKPGGCAAPADTRVAAAAGVAAPGAPAAGHRLAARPSDGRRGAHLPRAVSARLDYVLKSYLHNGADARLVVEANLTAGTVTTFTFGGIVVTEPSEMMAILAITLSANIHPMVG
jgi:hypothetical protein